MECLSEELEVSTREVPPLWKVANVTAIYKGMKEEPGNSRPV